MICFFKRIIFLCPLFFALSGHVSGQGNGNGWQLRVTGSFFKNWKESEKKEVQWYRLRVPENWANSAKKIDLAVAVLPAYKTTEKYVVHISGGPGGWCIGTIKRWMNHPLRNEANIVLVDLRGTGFSEPGLCPDLGKSILGVFAQNNPVQTDIDSIVRISEQCKDDLTRRGIDIKSYNSGYVVKDLNALRQSLGIKKWFVYGVSYGTHIAQLYAEKYSTDVDGVILDSPIPSLAEYYPGNSANFVNSIHLLFNGVKDKYPDIEQRYYAVVDRLSKNAVSIGVDKSLIPSGTFTYNTDDFKIIIQQALYNKQLIEVIPLIIDAFYFERKPVLENLVKSFSEALRRDFGTYYCLTCNDGYTGGSIQSFDSVAASFTKNNGGLLFYRSDLFVCKNWGLTKTDFADGAAFQTDSTLSALVFAGKFDPITPLSNGAKTVKKYARGFLFELPYGHATSFSAYGRDIVTAFVNNSAQRPTSGKALGEVRFVTNVKQNAGIVNLAGSLNKPDWIFLSPLLIAVLLITGFGVACAASLIRKKRNNAVFKVLVIVNAATALAVLLGLVLAIVKTSELNSYTFLFGLPDSYGFLFPLIYVLCGGTLACLCFFVPKIRKFQHRELVIGGLFSFLLVLIYLGYWGIL